MEHRVTTWLMETFLGRLSRRYLSMEMDGFRRTAESAP
jgi:hypothetical protein